MKSATTPTGRPKLGGCLDVRVTDPDEWLRGEIFMVGDARDDFGQSRFIVDIAFSDGTSTGRVRWDELEWRQIAGTS